MPLKCAWAHLTLRSHARQQSYCKSMLVVSYRSWPDNQMACLPFGFDDTPDIVVLLTQCGKQTTPTESEATPSEVRHGNAIPMMNKLHVVPRHALQCAVCVHHHSSFSDQSHCRKVCHWGQTLPARIQSCSLASAPSADRTVLHVVLLLSFAAVFLQLTSLPLVLQTEGRNSEEAAGEPSCGGRCILSDQPSGQLDDGLEKQHDIEAANPLNSVAIDAANPLSSDIAPAAGTEQPPATGVSGRLAKLKQMLWRRD